MAPGGVERVLPIAKEDKSPTTGPDTRGCSTGETNGSVWGNSPWNTMVSGESTCRLVRKEVSGERKEIQTQQMNNSGKEENRVEGLETETGAGKSARRDKRGKTQDNTGLYCGDPEKGL